MGSVIIFCFSFFIVSFWFFSLFFISLASGLSIFLIFSKNQLQVCSEYFNMYIFLCLSHYFYELKLLSQKMCLTFWCILTNFLPERWTIYYKLVICYFYGMSSYLQFIHIQYLFCVVLVKISLHMENRLGEWGVSDKGERETFFNLYILI